MAGGTEDFDILERKGCLGRRRIDEYLAVIKEARWAFSWWSHGWVSDYFRR